MGLRDYRKYKKEQELKGSETISLLLKRIDELEKKVAELEKRSTPSASSYDKLSEEEKKKIKAVQDGKTKPEDFIKLFTGNIEEFNPNA